MKKFTLFSALHAYPKYGMYLFFIFLFSACYTQNGQDNLGSEGEFSSSSEEIPSTENLREAWKKGFVFVTSVIDGDTFWVVNGEERFKVRFIGIDAPELRNSRHKQKGPYAKEAKAYVQQRCELQWVRLELDVQKTDRYARTLAYVYLPDNTFLNAALVREGFAVLATYPPNIKYVDLFTQLQAEAREHKRGLWQY